MGELLACLQLLIGRYFVLVLVRCPLDLIMCLSVIWISFGMLLVRTSQL